MKIILLWLTIFGLISCGGSSGGGDLTEVDPVDDKKKTSDVEETSTFVTANFTPANITDGTESIITLTYTDEQGRDAEGCSLGGLTNVTESTSCACVAGVCTVGITATPAYFGSAQFSFGVGIDSDISNVSVVSLSVDINPTACPTGFVSVDGNGGLGTTDFCVMKYEAKNNGSNEVIAQASDTPYVAITAVDAFTKCGNMTEAGFTGTFSLIANNEWMTIARDAEDVISNWSGGVVGTGHLARGWAANAILGDGFGNTSPAATTNAACLHNTAADTCGAAGTHKGRRTLILSNGSEIWDFSGNVSEWTDWDSSDSIYTARINDGDNGGWNIIGDLVGSITADELSPSGAYSTAHNTGEWTPLSHISFLYGAKRGGSYGQGPKAGMYNLVNTNPAQPMADLGFRCVYRR